MTQEDKAKRYDEAIERAKEWYYDAQIGIGFKANLEKLFPELKESEDEKIRKELIEMVRRWASVHYITKEQFRKRMTWLEKQGKHSIYNVPSREVILAIWDLGNEWKELTNGCISTKYGTQLNYIQKHWEESEYYLREKQDEQKPTDKVEPKFPEGEWITTEDYTWKIISVDSLDYTLQNQCGEYVYDTVDYVNKAFHLWTLQDAKNGDVLACNEEILLFKSYSVQGLISLYCWYNGQTNNFQSKEVDDMLLSTRNKICPATKEQRDLLFTKMKADGYKWNPETKTLEKLHEPKFKVGDRIIYKSMYLAGKYGVFSIYRITEDEYVVVIENTQQQKTISIQDQNEFMIAPEMRLVLEEKFDITTLKPFDKVLVRGDVGQKWTHDFFGFMDKDKGYPFVCVGHYVIQCIPYEGNEHLLGKTDDCDDFYKTWEKLL